MTVPSDPTRLAAVGAIGELLLEGPFLARGYLDQPEATSAAFIELPAWRQQISGCPSQRLYRTRDLVQYQADGSIRYIGRKNSCIKLRGQLVDLSVVEASVMRLCPQAAEVVADVLVSSSTALLAVSISNTNKTSGDTIFGKPDEAFRQTASFIQGRLRAMVPLTWSHPSSCP